jgi:DNA-binding beta-propeller fold protein YncE
MIKKVSFLWSYFLLGILIAACNNSTSVTVFSQPPDAKIEFIWKIMGEIYPLDKPVGVAVDTHGDVYVVDTGNSRVQKFDSNGKFLLTWGSHGNGDGQFNIETLLEGRIAVDNAGNVYVADVDNHRIQKFDSQGVFLTKWGTEGDGDGQFIEIADLAIDLQNNVYVVDYKNNTVQKFDQDGIFLLGWGQHGTQDGKFIAAATVAVDAQGHVYIGDMTSRIQEFDSNGNLIEVIQVEPIEQRPIDLWNLAVDDQGNFYIADHNSYRIVKLDNDGEFLAYWGSGGSDDGQFRSLQDVAVDKEGNIYTTDSANCSVQKFHQPDFP